MKKVYVTKTHVDDFSVDELDFVLHDEFGFDYEVHDDFEVIRKGDGRNEGFPIKIDTMIEKLNKLKTDGATHVELDYHCDHIGYDVSVFEIRKSTEEEICEFDKEYLKEKEKQEKIRDLYKQINEIKNS